MNLPNQLTLLRLVLTAGFVVALSGTWRWGFTAGFVLFAAAALTDYADGEIARRWNLVTDFGKLMDPLADKVLLAAGFVFLVPAGAFPPWTVVLILAREFLVTGLRAVAAAKGAVLPAERLGKHKTIWQIVAVLYFLLLLAVQEVSTDAFQSWGALAWNVGGPILVALALALTVWSGAAYVWHNRGLIAAR